MVHRGLQYSALYIHNRTVEDLALNTALRGPHGGMAQGCKCSYETFVWPGTDAWVSQVVPRALPLLWPHHRHHTVGPYIWHPLTSDPLRGRERRPCLPNLAPTTLGSCKPHRKNHRLDYHTTETKPLNNYLSNSNYLEHIIG